MTRSLTTDLAANAPSDWSVRAVTGLLGVLPFAATWRPPASLEEAAAAVDPALAPRIAARAEQLARAEGPQAALAAFDFLDKGDTGIAVFSGLRGAVKAVKGQEGALEMDPQQAADAGLKAVGIAWAAWKLYEGSASDRARALLSTPGGRALLTWYVSADLVLPFADNLASGGVDTITGVIDAGAADNAARLAAVAGPEVVEATGVLHGMIDAVRGALGQAATYAAPLSAWVQEQLPGVLATTDTVTGVVATAVDTLACYRVLGTALVAEVCVARAAEEVRAEVKAEAEAAEAARKAEEARREAERAAQAAAAEAARKAAEEAKRREDEERLAEAQRRIAEEQARRAASKQKEDYTLDEPVEAASLKNNPVKVTRAAEITPAADATPARTGCLGCGTVVLAVMVLGAAGAIAALA